MSIKSRYKGVVRYAVGLIKDATGRGDSYEQQVDAWKAEADCGCGIDCCNKRIVMTDRVTGNHVEIFVSNGELVFKVLPDGSEKQVLTA